MVSQQETSQRLIGRIRAQSTVRIYRSCGRNTAQRFSPIFARLAVKLSIHDKSGRRVKSWTRQGGVQPANRKGLRCQAPIAVGLKCALLRPCDWAG
jgi:hypothetical protein